MGAGLFFQGPDKASDCNEQWNGQDNPPHPEETSQNKNANKCGQWLNSSAGGSEIWASDAAFNLLNQQDKYQGKAGSLQTMRQCTQNYRNRTENRSYIWKDF